MTSDVDLKPIMTTKDYAAGNEPGVRIMVMQQEITSLRDALLAMRSHWLLLNRPETDEIARAVLAVVDDALRQR